MFLCAVVLLCTVVPWMASSSVNELGIPLQAPSLSHIFGTDELGRDVFVRTMTGGRIDLGLAVAGVSVSLVLGTLLGTLAGATKVRSLDAALMRLVDAFVAFPFIVLVLVLVVLIGPERSLGPLPPGIPAVFVALVLTDWAWYARLAHAQTLSLCERDYVVAARLMGFSGYRVIRHHLVPSVFRVNAAYGVGDAILFVIATASLAFLGAGVQPPVPEWGAIMFEGRAYLDSAWWITLMPGAVLAATGLALSLVADSLLAKSGSGQ